VCGESQDAPSAVVLQKSERERWVTEPCQPLDFVSSHLHDFPTEEKPACGLVRYLLAPFSNNTRQRIYLRRGELWAMRCDERPIPFLANSAKTGTGIRDVERWVTQLGYVLKRVRRVVLVPVRRIDIVTFMTVIEYVRSDDGRSWEREESPRLRHLRAFPLLSGFG
jgi:hypothetical protein